MAWFDDWRSRMTAIRSIGLPVIITGLELQDNGFLSICLDVEEVYLPRSHADRGFDLHVSIGYIQDYDDLTTALEAALRLHNRWSGRWTLLNISWIGSGGAAYLHTYDMLNDDEDFTYLYSRGRYRARGAHVSL
jgi:hypothetical protein